MEGLLKESQMQRNLDHPFIVHAYGVLEETDGTMSVVSDFVKGGSLLEEVEAHRGLYEQRIRRFSVQLLSALKYLHSENNVVHRDIKLENILLENEFVRLIDFGFSRDVDPAMATRCGTIHYAAPELLLGNSYNAEIDLWSFGVVVYAMFEGLLPFRQTATQDVIRAIARDPPEKMLHGSASAQDFVNALLTKDPDKRIQIEAAIVHPFIAGADNAYLLTEPEILERPEFCVDVKSAVLDPVIVEKLVGLGYEREKIRPYSGLMIREEAELAYEIEKVAAVRSALTGLVNDRNVQKKLRRSVGHATTMTFTPWRLAGATSPKPAVLVTPQIPTRRREFSKSPAPMTRGTPAARPPGWIYNLDT
jgi:serine/threonine protein kinase